MAEPGVQGPGHPGPPGLPGGPRRARLGPAIVLGVGALAGCGGDGTTGPTPGTLEPASLNLVVERAWVTQATQRPDGTVPLVEGRAAYVRVFPVANENNTARPAVRVRLYQNGTLFDSVRIAAPGSGVPLSADPSILDGSWNARLRPSQVREGLSIQAVVDPDGSVAEVSEGDNVFPATGSPLEVEVVDLPPLQVRLVPVEMGPNTGGVPDDQVEDYVALARKLLPADTLEADVRGDAFASTFDEVTTQNLLDVLGEIRTLQRGEGGERIYIGVVDERAWTASALGLAFVNGNAAVMRSTGDVRVRGELTAHLLGHTLGLRNAPACDGGGDGDFPYANDAIGQVGFDVPAAALVPADTRDVMTACGLNEPWISDHNWELMLEERRRRAGPP